MGREKQLEKKITQNLDRILAGGEIKPDPAMDKELGDTLNFARKMAALRPAPSAQYQSRLKAQLLQKLEEREALKRERWSGFWSMLRTNRVWQGAAAALFVIIIISIVWRSGFFQPAFESPSTTYPAATTTQGAPAPAAAPFPATLISVDATTDKATYRPGEPVVINLNMKNVSPDPITLDKFPPILSLMNEETGQPVYTFSAGKNNLTLMPNADARFTLTWNEVDFYGRPVTGKYYIELEDLDYQGRAIKLNLNKPARFEILPAPASLK
jgi:hypothetical protein